MHKAVMPIFPMGTISSYHFTGNTFDLNLLKDLPVRGPVGNISTTQIGQTRNENILELDIFKNIKTFITNSVKHYLDSIDGVIYEDFWISSSWVNFCTTGGSQAVHNHGNSLVSGCFYIHANAEHPGLYFKRPEFELQPYFVSQHREINPARANEVEFKVASNDLLLFPSHLYHGHKPNSSTETRVGLAFNVLYNQPEEIMPPGWYHIRYEK